VTTGVRVVRDVLSSRPQSRTFLRRRNAAPAQGQAPVRLKARPTNAAAGEPECRPFPPLDAPPAQAQLTRMLKAWETHSKAPLTLELPISNVGTYGPHRGTRRILR